MPWVLIAGQCQREIDGVVAVGEKKRMTGSNRALVEFARGGTPYAARQKFKATGDRDSGRTRAKVDLGK